MSLETTAFADSFADMIVALEPDPALHRPLHLALRLVTAALSASASHIRLADIDPSLTETLSVADRHFIDNPALWREKLLASRLVCRDGETVSHHPLVLRAPDRLYLSRYDDYERRLCRALSDRLAKPALPIGAAAMAFLDKIFVDEPSGPNRQAEAVRMALSRPISVLSGGPGRGKTYAIVATIVCALLDDPTVQIRLAAPTGKAAARLGEAIANQMPTLADSVDDQTLATMSALRPATLHRLLGLKPLSFSSDHRKPNLSGVDLLIVDEASMLDLALAVHLFEALSPTGRLLLVGDGDQLPPVEAGAPFIDLMAIAERRRADSPSASFMTRLEKPHRFLAESPVAKLAERVLSGDSAAILADGSPVEPIMPTATLRDGILAGYRPLIEQVQRDPSDLDAIFAAMNRFKVLSPIYAGRHGVDALNSQVGSAVARQTTGRPHLRHYPGQLILVTQNDGHKLFNGDVGIVLPTDSGALRVHFKTVDGILILPPALLPPHETAFVMTVHKAQGSEFDEVLLILPDYADNLVSKRLIYTAVTRARSTVTIQCEPRTLQTAVSRVDRLDSNLIDRFDPSVIFGDPLEPV